MNLEQLQKFCLSFPGATEDIKWGADLCFCIGEKMFCVTGADSIAGGLSLKCTPEKFAELIEREGIDPAAYPVLLKHVEKVMAVPAVAAVLERERIKLDTYKAAA